MATTIFEHQAQANDGRAVSLETYHGKALLIVNTASNCGFTPQYKGLEALHRKYADQGLVVLGFPCDQFAHQEPGSDSEIALFCSRNFGVSFPLMSKIEVNGPNAHPLFADLRKRAPGIIGDQIKWNFTKFLVTRDGLTVKRFAPTVEPETMEADILKALGA
ncbi:MAG: glutathione peroxidase [Spirochaetes bacterium GWD1_61_31]|nr:MAG: glutathione peroxidase [Spirochaetes bacterium GWB1_60_80]OHD31909.1 MAG: glutathione peroxidase [Spirochaetes bacterium GWC1_61_12]OHD39994.1 MAG: glutathione peroxidase [Spirochaetes bacterium GWD1_61_31]OHD42352.1 MAG: glutathione peroxidase [Spirochaetes bacterium GWE1_60_18]OHD60524.1 MAG: glutathione peroxidase [Spirochaetes bacterium GWF1_60_12]HAW86962.1 glutathione peroxidase [Spirochaetaceae bacterium]